MKHILMLIFSVLTISVYGQDKSNYVYYNKLTEITGTDYALATIEHLGKMFTTQSQYLLFINTRTGEPKQIDFPKDAYIRDVEQIRIDSLQLNKILVVAKTVNLDNDKKGIDGSDPSTILLFSTDGQEKKQLTEDKFYAHTWVLNRQTGAIVVTGYYDSNNSGKYEKTDINQILVFDLKSGSLIKKI